VSAPLLDGPSLNHPEVMLGAPDVLFKTEYRLHQ
jgi:hypothetical protein